MLSPEIDFYRKCNQLASLENHINGSKARKIRQYIEIDDIRNLEHIEEEEYALAPDLFNIYIDDIHEAKLH